MNEESIYNIIPHNPQVSPKKPLYKSKYPYYIPPTGSTFANHTTSRPGVANLSGQFEIGLQAHTNKSATQTFGHAKGDRVPLPKNYQKKRSGTMGSHQLPPTRNFSYDCKHCKDPVPKATQRPIYGKSSKKDFIVSNAIEAILSTPRQLPKQQNWTKKKDYGKKPQYLTFIQETLDSEYKMLQTLHQEREQKQNMLSQQQVKQIREGLKRKWNQINAQYQQITHVRVIDTLGLRTKKLKMEAQLAQIQQDIRKLNKQYIFVE